MNKTIMPPGKYYIGDLCYVVPDENWYDVCQKMKETDYTFTVGEVDGKKFAVSSTQWGDGGYESNIGFVFGVDAGSIGCIQIDDSHNPIGFGVIHIFTEPFEVVGATKNHRKDWDGVIQIGHIKIDTDPTEEEDDR